MKKTLFLLLAFAASMSINAQVMKLLKDNEVVAIYSVDQVNKVVFQKDQTPTRGTATRNDNVQVKWIQLWENGPKFAEYNVGANSAATEYGGYYAWGGHQDKVDDHYIGNSVLTGDNDTATKLWGSNWRMPTKEEFEALLDKCDVAWTDNYNGTNIKGIIFTGKVAPYNANSVFLPAAGYCHSGGVIGQGSGGSYWSSTPNGSNYAYFLFYSSGYKYVYDDFRYEGYSVRAVLKEQ